ncbi:MAG: hypothetical protein ACTIJY_08650 [Luteimonas sp.]
MGRGRRGFFDGLARLPWPVALVVGLIGYAGIRHGVPAFFARQDHPLLQGFASGTLVPLAWIFLAACTLCALVAFANAHKRRRLLDTRVIPPLFTDYRSGAMQPLPASVPA